MGLNCDLAFVKKSKSRIVLLFFVLILITLGSTYAFVVGDLDPNLNIVHAAATPLCPDGSQLGLIGNCHPAAEPPPASLDQQHQSQQQEQQQHQPLCPDGSRPDASSNCFSPTTQSIGRTR